MLAILKHNLQFTKKNRRTIAGHEKLDIGHKDILSNDCSPKLLDDKSFISRHQLYTEKHFDRNTTYPHGKHVYRAATVVFRNASQKKYAGLGEFRETGHWQHRPFPRFRFTQADLPGYYSCLLPFGTR